MGESIKNNNAVVDVFRLILCIMVVAIHTGIFHDYLYPWLSLAVPLFFIMSAYFFFNKIKLSENTFPALKNLYLKILNIIVFIWLFFRRSFYIQSAIFQPAFLRVLRILL